ncbi:MAG: DUF5067 domain-containing protein [Actinobacteria bacterium]|nr:DUF5067 domain-containing protein [Actinomycetota bacterium]
MNKVLGAVIALLLLTSCGAPTGATTAEAPSEPAAAATDAPDATPEEEPATEEEPSAESEYAVAIDGHSLTKDHDGKPVLVVDFTFTNNSEDAASFMFALRAKAFQDGIELEDAILIGNKKYDSANTMKEIKPGKSLKVQQAFSLDNKKDDVEIEVTKLLSFDDALLATKTITLK